MFVIARSVATEAKLAIGQPIQGRANRPGLLRYARNDECGGIGEIESRKPSTMVR